MQINRAALSTIVPSPCFDRPFVCDGHPADADVLIVGGNPATPLSADWWQWWSDEAGFDYAAFERHYDGVRGPATGVRRRLKIMRNEGLRAVETNVYANVNLRGVGKKKVSNLAVVNLLAGGMPRLRAVVVHGDVARKAMEDVTLRDKVDRLDINHIASRDGRMSDDILRKKLGAYLKP